MSIINSDPFRTTPGWFITFKNNVVRLHHDITNFESFVTEEVISNYDSLEDCLQACARLNINPVIYN